MSQLPPEDSILAFTHSDRAAAEELRRALRVLRDRATDQQSARMFDDVLSGRRRLREVSRDPAFLEVVTGGMRLMSQRWAEMSPQERVQLAEQGRAEETDVRVDVGLPPSADDVPIGEFGPALTDPHPEERG